MSGALSPNTKAILLLTAPLIAGGGKRAANLLTLSEYTRLARHLRQIGRQPADFLAPAADEILAECDPVISRARLEPLLARGFVLSQALEHWQARAIWVVSRADSVYPQRLKTHLRESSPPLLYGCGDPGALDGGGLAVVGSRNVDDALIDYAHEIGRLAAAAGRTLVSGGARGIDQAAMRGALEAEGRAIGILSDSLERTAMRREHRNMLLESRLLLVSPYDPAVRFNVGHAMQRNKLIYALADAALVVNAEPGKGGTWAGATEQLDKLHLVPVYVRSTGADSEGLDALRMKGALPWPNPEDTDGLNAALAIPVPRPFSSPGTNQLSFTYQAGDGSTQPQEVAEASPSKGAALTGDEAEASAAPAAGTEPERPAG